MKKSSHEIVRRTCGRDRDAKKRGLSPIDSIVLRRETNRYFVLIFLVLYVGIVLPKYLLAVSQSLSIAVDVAVHAIIPLSIFFAFYFFCRPIASDMASEFKWAWSGVIVSILLGLVSVQIDLRLIILLTDFFNPPTIDQPDFVKFVITNFGLKGVLYLALTAGLFEEWLFKTVLIRSFKKVPSQLVFVSVSATLFGAVHYGQGVIAVIVYILCFGIPTAIYYYQKRNILNLVVVHTVLDLWLMLWVWAKNIR